MTLIELKKDFADRFSKAGFEAADLEAHFIVCEATGIPDREFALHAHEMLTAKVRTRAESFLARRLSNEPWQYIFGHAPFRELELAVGPGCLIPRPETEYSVGLMLDGLPYGASVCELGAGSGAISLALASERPDLTVVGVELSPDALKWAELNLKKLSLPNVTFLHGDLFAPVAGRTFDLIAANLPYIPDGDRGKLPPNVRNARKGSPDAEKDKNGVYAWEDCGPRIDYIYVSDGIKVKAYATHADPREGTHLYPSDHFPVTAVIEL